MISLLSPKRRDGLLTSSTILALVIGLIIHPVIGQAQPAIPGLHVPTGRITAPSPQTLPVLKGVIQGVSSVVETPARHRLDIHQDQPKAIIDWHSFNIGREAWTHFDQQKHTDWTALNRIYDQNPSLIFGRLTADGKVYLINQNGILFGPTSQVNVHSLVASSLQTTNQEFLDGLLVFRGGQYDPDTDTIDTTDIDMDAIVSNQGTIATDSFGGIFLLGPTVENQGTIIAPDGHAVLAAGTHVELTRDEGIPGTGPAARITRNPGEAFNREAGRIIADRGLAGMYGSVVNQEGLIRSVTALKQNGRIELRASERVSTGPKSVTACPISDSPETAHPSFSVVESKIALAGLDDDHPVERIEHRGVIEAPSGLVELTAGERIYLETGSRIDVSGAWVERPADAHLMDVQLYSVELTDDFGQKDGILKGDTVQVRPETGSSIGHIDGYLRSWETTARERSTEGGIVELQATSGDIVVKQDATIDFSGGGVRYAGGHAETTKLVTGQKAYDISDAPQWVVYDEALGVQEVRYARYGITEEFKGLYFGGANPVKDYAAGHVEGDDAGELRLMARTMVLDGALDGSVERGLYQTEASEPQDEYGYQTQRGRKEPTAGTLIIGEPPQALALPETVDTLVDEVVIKADVAPLPETFGPDDPRPARPSPFSDEQRTLQQTWLSAKKLTDADLSNLEIYTNTQLTTEKDARITLRPGGWKEGWKDHTGAMSGRFVANARSILHQGEIHVPGGMVQLKTRSNITSAPTIAGRTNPRYIPMDEKAYLAPGSKISVVGERIDNSLAQTGGDGRIRPGHIHGGLVSIADKAGEGQGVIVMPGASIDVSGGYAIDPDGRISGGDAGALELEASTLIIEGELQGYSLPDRDGGTVVLHADEVTVASTVPSLPEGFTPDSEIPDDWKHQLRLPQSLLPEGGFTDITLKSVYDLTLIDGVHLSTSALKLPVPMPGVGRFQDQVYRNRLQIGEDLGFQTDRPQAVSQAYLRPSSVTLAGGEDREGFEVDDNLDAKITVRPGADVRVAPQGAVTIEAPDIEVAGLLDVPSGSVSLIASRHDVRLTESARILAAGTQRLETEPLVERIPILPTPLPGGTVTITATEDVFLEPGSRIDVSGSLPTTALMRDGDTLTPFMMAGSPGDITLSYGDRLNPLRDPDGTLLDPGGSLQGVDLQGRARLMGLRGGSLTVQGRKDLTVFPEDTAAFVKGGFDALSFESWTGIDFAGPMDVTIGRKLALDAPEFRGPEEGLVHLHAPWLRLSNRSDKYPLGQPCYPFIPDEAEPGTARLGLSGDWIDVEGSLVLSGFERVELDASRDITLRDDLYTRTWEGMLKTSGDLTLTAGRIYPTTLSDFTLKAGTAITTRSESGPASGPILSAGARVALSAPHITHGGFLAAPMGEIVFEGPDGESYVSLTDGSTLTTTGQAPVSYGELDDVFWTITDKSPIPKAEGIEVSGAPAKSIRIEGTKVAVEEGAVIDSSGGGSVFGREFLPSVEGTENPLTQKGRYIILPADPLARPGEAIYLAGQDGLPEGTYSLLPEEYAFVPGALVLTDLGTEPMAGDRMRSEEGYTVVTGYQAIAGTEMRSPEGRHYSLRPATDVLGEGYFQILGHAAGRGGDVTVAGKTTILDGTITGHPLPGYTGGLLSLSGAEVFIRPTTTVVPPGDPEGKLTLTATAVSGSGFGTIQIGDPKQTGRITVEAGSVFEGPSLTLAASDEIVLEPGAELHVLGPGASARLVAPQGSIRIQEGALVHASESIDVDTQDLDLQGDLQVDQSAMTLLGDRIFVAPEDYSGDRLEGLYLTEKLWRSFEAIDHIGLTSRSDLVFLGDVDLTVGESLTIDAARIAGFETAGEATVSLSSHRIALLSTSAGLEETTLDDTGLITLKAAEISIGEGDILFDGFREVDLVAQRDLTLLGQGSLVVGGDLMMTAARVATAPYAHKDSQGKTRYEVTDFQVKADSGSIAVFKSGGTPGEPLAPGGRLGFLGQAIDLAGIVDTPSGQIEFTATGADEGGGIVLASGAQILARGRDDAPGGRVALRTEGGSVAIQSGALIDVSAGAQGDAGTVLLSAPEKGVTLDGDLQGHAAGGRGGSLILDTDEMDDLGSINPLLQAGGFDQRIDLHIRQGDVSIPTDQIIHAHDFRLTADGGSIAVWGTIDAQGDQGGWVELWAQDDLSLHGGSSIRAQGTGSDSSGGEVLLSAAEGLLRFEEGASLDLYGTRQGGRATFRALREDQGVQMELQGTVAGASQVVAEAVRVYEDSAIEASEIGPGGRYWDDTTAYMASPPDVGSGLTLEDPGVFHLLPGIEIRSEADLTLASEWDFTRSGRWWRYDGEPGVLTLRAGGDLRIEKPLVDHPHFSPQLPGDPGLDSWTIRLAGGGDFDRDSHQWSANPLAVEQEGGGLKIADGSLVYTESAPIRFASAGDAILGRAPAKPYMINTDLNYSLGTYDGSIRGHVGESLIIQGGGIQAATGGIEVRTGRNLLFDLGTAGPAHQFSPAIRTTGQGPNFYQFQDGGSIVLDVGGSIITQGSFGSKAWDWAYTEEVWDLLPGSIVKRWAASYEKVLGGGTVKALPTAGLATMAGGDLTVYTGGSFTCQAGAFGAGDLTIYAGGDMDGRFLVKDGTGVLNAMGSFGTDPQILHQPIEAFDAQITATAQGHFELGAVVNPTAVGEGFLSSWLLGYTEDTRVKIKTVSGDVSIYGDSGFHERYGVKNFDRERILPPTFEIESGGDIHFENALVLAPSPTGNLRLIAGGDITGDYLVGGSSSTVSKVWSQILLSDISPEAVYAHYEKPQYALRDASGEVIRVIGYDIDWTTFSSRFEHGFPAGYVEMYETMMETEMDLPPGSQPLLDEDAKAYFLTLRDRIYDARPLHQGDDVPVELTAGRNIESLRLYSAKFAHITAGQDIRDVFYFGQNLSAEDLTSIRAGGDIILGSLQQSFETGIRLGGPGSLLVQAGGTLDLGTTEGIETHGNLFYTQLGSEGSSVIVISGYDTLMEPEEVGLFFDDLREAGTTYSTLLADGYVAEAQDVVHEARRSIISPFLGTPTGEGTINMTRSQISTASGGDVSVIAAGTFNVGMSAFATEEEKESTGINTQSGGSIDIFAGRDVNVNESRVMTWLGGDVSVWSDQGDINAGKGSKTAVNTGKPVRVFVGGRWLLQRRPAAVGSGIRTLTFDPDGIEGPMPEPPPGDIYLFAPQGVIDAGEAGISGRNIILGATEIVNIQNITFSQGSVGVPMGSESTGALSALAGAGSVAEASRMTEQASDLGSARERLASAIKKLAEALNIRWLQVEFIGFDEDDEE